MIRIVFYNHTGQMSGAEKMLLIGLKNLPRERFDPVLVCPQSGPLAATAAREGIQVYSSHPIIARFTSNPILLVRYLMSILVCLLQLRRTLQNLKPDIVHANTVRAGITGTLATVGTKIPVIWHNHDMLPTEHPLTFAIRVLVWSSARVRVVACSKAAADTLKPLSHAQREPAVIYNGCRIKFEIPGESWRAEKRRKLGVSPQSFVIANVGQIAPRKRQLEMIRAFADVRGHVPESILIVCGAPLFNDDELYLQRLYRETKDLGLESSVYFTGHRPDAIEIISASDLYILNSSKEPFALTIVEAMTVGTPVVATDCGGPSEIINHGVNGEIVSLNELNEWVRTIARLAGDPELRQKYAGAARLTTRQRFSQETYIRNWCNLYSDICNPEDQATKSRDSQLDFQFPNGVRR